MLSGGQNPTNGDIDEVADESFRRTRDFGLAHWRIVVLA